MRSTIISGLTFFVLISGCSLFKPTYKETNHYLPLAVGNKWIYNINPERENQRIEDIVEVISEEVINGKKYFMIKDSTTGTHKNFVNYYYYRLSNDTLFVLNYDTKGDNYTERVDAIFSLNIGEMAKFIIPPDTAIIPLDTTGTRIARLPPGDYTIEVIIKKDDLMEFFFHRGSADSNHRIVYQKGVGLIKTKNAWGIEKILQDYELK